MIKIYKLTPFFSERLWGGSKLKDYGFHLPTNELYGEAWVISALENGMTYISEGEFKGMSLKDFFVQHKFLFNKKDDVFPLLSKIITANDYLSVQVHPNDAYSLEHNKMLGKPECWYVLDCPENAKLIYGHHAKTKAELIEKVNAKKWNDLFVEVSVQKGDFLYVPPGKIHAITPGVIVFELQRSSDITYRFYDFDRQDKNGNLRDLHLRECFDVTTVPDQKIEIVQKTSGNLIRNEYFTLDLLQGDKKVAIKTKILFGDVKWAQITVVDGEITVQQVVIKAGESAILTDLEDNLEFRVAGRGFLSYCDNK